MTVTNTPTYCNKEILQYKLVVLIANISFVFKDLVGVNALAYFVSPSAPEKKSVITSQRALRRSVGERRHLSPGLLLVRPEGPLLSRIHLLRVCLPTGILHSTCQQEASSRFLLFLVLIPLHLRFLYIGEVTARNSNSHW
jgi:hypothetical protein